MNQTERIAWLKARQKGIGGSDVAAILGISPWKNRHQVWLEKVSQDPIEIPDNDPMYWGRKLEAVIADEFMSKSGRKVVRENSVIHHKRLPFLLANIDRRILADDHAVVADPIMKGTGVLEVKTVGSFAFKEWEAQVPIHYYCQLQHYLFVLDYQWGAFAILSGGNQYYSFEVVRDDKWIAEDMLPTLADFWHNNVEAMVPPPMDHTDYAKLLPKLGTIVEADAKILALCTDRVIAHEALKKAESRKEEVENQIKTIMGENEAIVHGGKAIVTWKKSAGKKSCDFEKLKELDPKIYKKVVKQGEDGRRFNFQFRTTEEE